MLNEAALYKTMALALTLVAESAFAQTARLEFRGVPMGVSESEFKKQIPHLFTCLAVKPPRTLLGDRSREFDKEMKDAFRETLCNAKERRNEKVDAACTSWSDTLYGGAEMVASRAFFYNDKLATVVIAIQPDDFERVTNALQSKYGRPTAVSNAPVVTKGGLKIKNTEVEWISPPGRITATQYSIDINTSQIAIESDVGREEYARRKALQEKRDAKKL